MLVKIIKSDLPIYRRLYQTQWPKHIVTFGLFDHFIKRFEKLPEWEEKVQFLKSEKCEINDGTFVFINGPHIYFDTFESSPYDKLYNLMNELDYSEEKVFIGVRDDFRPFLHDLIRIQYLEKTFDTGTRCINMTQNMDLETIKALSSELSSRMPKGYYDKELTEEDAEKMNKIWAQRHIGSVDFLKTAIRMNPSTGIYKDNGELIAWTIFLETGAMGNLQVVDDHKRKDFAGIVSACQYFKIAQMGIVPFGHIVHSNDASFNFSTKRYSGAWVGNNSWIGVKKRPKPELAPLWGHM